MKRRLALALALVVALAIAVVTWKSCRTGEETLPSKSVVQTPLPNTTHVGHRDPRAIPLASIAGTITDVDGAPVAGARACATMWPGHAAMPRCATTDARGAYVIDALAAGHYLAAAAARPFSPTSYAAELNLWPGQRLTGIDFVLRGTGVEVTGTVVDLTGGPVPRAMVRTSTAPPVEADDAGRFSLWTARGYVRVIATADGYAEGAEDGTAPADLVIALTPESSIAGVVVDGATREPVAGAEVSISDTGRAFPHPAGITDDDGRFRIDHLGPGRYAITAQQPGRYGASDGAVMVGLAHHTDGVTVALFSIARVEGRVAIAGSPPRPCPRPLLVLSPPRAGTPIYAFGQPDGTVAADAALPGTYRASATCEGPYVESESTELDVGDTDVVGLSWEVTAATSIVRGRVLDARGAPVAGAEVSASGTADVTDRDGRYVLADLRYVPHDLRVETDVGVAPPGGFVIDDALRRNAVVEKDLVLEDAGRIDGVVVDTAGRPVEHAKVLASRDDRDDGSVGYDVWTARDGRFELRGLAASTYRVSIDGEMEVVAQTVEIRAAKSTAVRLVIEARTSAIRGTVRDGRGDPIADAYVIATRERTGYSSIGAGRWGTRDTVLTDVDGAFVIEGLPAGSYTVLAARRGGGDAFAEHVSTGASVTIRIADTATIEGTVRQRGGIAPELNVHVASSTRLTRVERFYRTDGHYALRDLPPGSYTITAQTGGRRGVRRVDVAAGQRATGIDIDLDGGIAVRGRVIDPIAAHPVAGVQIRVGPNDAYSYELDSVGGGAIAATTAADGTFQIDHAPLGSVRFEGEHPGDYGTFMFKRTLDGSARSISVTSASSGTATRAPSASRGAAAR